VPILFVQDSVGTVYCVMNAVAMSGSNRYYASPFPSRLVELDRGWSMLTEVVDVAEIVAEVDRGC
jgi:hypothetical protein